MHVVIFGSLASSLVNFRGDLIKDLISAGYTVTAISPGISADINTRTWLENAGASWYDVPLSRAGINPVQDVKTLACLFLIFNKIKPDVFYCYTIKPVIWGLLSAKLSRVPNRVAAITGLGYAFTGNRKGKRGLVSSIARILYKFSLSHAHTLFFQNSDDRDEFYSLRLIAPSTEVKLVNGSGVNLQHFSRTEFPSPPIKFLLIARLLGDKGIREYVAAAQQVKTQFPASEFHLVGGLDSNPDSIHREEIDDWVSSGAVTWHGALNDVRPIIAQSHVYVLPSYREGTPRSVLEAMAMGRPVITTDAPGCRDTVVDGLNGMLVPVKSVDDIVSAMKKFILQPLLVESMGAESYRIAVNKYDVIKVNQFILQSIGLSK